MSQTVDYATASSTKYRLRSHGTQAEIAIDSSILRQMHAVAGVGFLIVDMTVLCPHCGLTKESHCGLPDQPIVLPPVPPAIAKLAPESPQLWGERHSRIGACQARYFQADLAQAVRVFRQVRPSGVNDPHERATV